MPSAVPEWQLAVPSRTCVRGVLVARGRALVVLVFVCGVRGWASCKHSTAHTAKVSMIQSAGTSAKDGRRQASGGDRHEGEGQILRGELGYAVRACGQSGKEFLEPILRLDTVLLED